MSEDKKVLEAEDEKSATVEETTEETNDSVETDEDIDEVEEKVEPKTEPEIEEPKTDTTRPVYTMPVHKHVAVKKELEEKFSVREQELLAEIEQLKKQPTTTAGQQEQVDEETKALAERYNLEPGALAEIIGLATKKASGQSKEIQELIQANKIKQLQEEVKSDFDVKVLPLIQKDYPDATPNFIANVKKQISDLAFSQGYNTLSVDDIYFVGKGKGLIDFKNNYTAEPSGGKGSEHKNLSTITEKQALQLSPEEYLKWSDAQASKQSQWVD